MIYITHPFWDYSDTLNNNKKKSNIASSKHKHHPVITVNMNVPQIMFQDVSYSGNTANIQSQIYKQRPLSTRHIHKSKHDSLRNLSIICYFSPPIPCFGKIFRKYKNRIKKIFK